MMILWKETTNWNSNLACSSNDRGARPESSAVDGSTSAWWLSAMVAGGRAHAVNNAQNLRSKFAKALRAFSFEVHQSLREHAVGHQELHLSNFQCLLAKDGHSGKCLHEAGEALIGPNCARHDTAALARSRATYDHQGFTGEVERESGAVLVNRVFAYPTGTIPRNRLNTSNRSFRLGKKISVPLAKEEGHGLKAFKNPEGTKLNLTVFWN